RVRQFEYKCRVGDRPCDLSSKRPFESQPMSADSITTEALVVDPDAPDEAAIARAAQILRRGGLVAFPTETVYGLGADALNAEAVARLFVAKGRPANNPIIVHVADAAEIGRVAQPSTLALRLAERFWPGPLTL